MSLGFFVGASLCLLGFSGFFLVLVRAGALAKSKQLGAIAKILRGEAGPKERPMLLGAMVLCLLGACLLFVQVLQARARTLELVEKWTATQLAAFAVMLSWFTVAHLVFHQSLLRGNQPFIYFQF